MGVWHEEEEPNNEYDADIDAADREKDETES